MVIEETVNEILEDLAHTKKRLTVLEKTQDAFIVFMIEKLNNKELKRFEKYFLNAFNDCYELPEEALTILNVIKAYSTATYNRETKQAIKNCFDAIPNLDSYARSDSIFNDIGIVDTKKPAIPAKL